MAEIEDTSIECGFCCRKDEDMYRPKTLPCTHVHCLGCLTDFFELNHFTRCPTPDCGEVVDVPLEALPTYKPENIKCCDVCMDKELGNEPAIIYCITCEKKYCNKHEELHDALLSKHKKIEISEYGVQHKRLNSEMCVEHTDETYTMGCKVCLSLACLKCLSELGPCTDGSPHRVIALVDLVAALVEEDVKGLMIAKEEKLEKLFKQTSKLSCECEDKTREMLQLLRDTRDEQLRVIKQKYDELEEELLEKRQKKRVEIAEYMEGEVLTMWTQLRNQRHKLETKLKHNHHVDIVKGFSELKVEIQKLVDEELPKLQLTELIELNNKGVQRDVELSLASAEDIVIGWECVPLPKSMKHLQTVKLPANPISISHYKGSTYVGLENSCIARVDSDYSVCESFISCPGPVETVVVHEERIYVLLNFKKSTCYVFSVYDMCGSQVTQWNGFCKGNFCNPLTVVSDQLVVADKPNTRISVCSLTGQVLRNFPCSLFNATHFFIQGVDVSSVIVSGSTSSKVSRVNIDTGSVMWSASVSNPRGVCCYGRQYVLVGKYDSKDIQILDYETGQLLSQLTNDKVAGGRMYGLEVFGSVLVVASRDHTQVQFHQLS